MEGYFHGGDKMTHDNHSNCVYLDGFLIFQQSYSIGTISNPTLEMRKQRLNQVSQLAVVRTATAQRSEIQAQAVGL